MIDRERLRQDMERHRYQRGSFESFEKPFFRDNMRATEWEAEYRYINYTHNFSPFDKRRTLYALFQQGYWASEEEYLDFVAEVAVASMLDGIEEVHRLFNTLN